MATTPITVKSFSHFIELLETKGKKNLVLFRGQPNDDKLLPKIARKDSRKDSANLEKVND